MGIFKKIFDWTTHEPPADIDKNGKTASRQPAVPNSPIRSMTETLPAPVVSVTGLAALNSRVTELVAYPLENSRRLGVPTRNQVQDHFPTSPDWENERADRLQSTGLGGLSPDDGFLDQVVDAFDEAFDTACRSDTMQTHSISGSMQNYGDEATVRDLFAQIAANYSQPLKNFVFDLRCGTAFKDRLEFLRSSVQMIGDAAAKMDLAQAVKRITDFDDVLSMAQARPQRLLEGEVRGLILDSYQIESSLEKCTITLGIGTTLTIGPKGVLTGCQIIGGGEIVVHGKFYENGVSPGIRDPSRLIVGKTGVVSGAVQQPLSLTQFAFEHGCSLSLRILKAQ